MAGVGTNKQKGFEITDDKVLIYKGRICVPKDEGLRKEILEEAHSTAYTAHLGGTKMYLDLRNIFWWRNMKRKIGLFILEDMLRACVLVLSGSLESHLPLVEFAYNNSFQATIGMAPYEALYGRKCRSPICWDEVGERKILGPEIIDRTVHVVEKIRDRVKVAQNRQKSYVDRRRKDLEFQIGDKVFLKVAPMKEILRFGKKGKLKPKFIGPFDDPCHVINHQNLEVQHDLTYGEMLLRILERKIHALRNKEIPLTKILVEANHVEFEFFN
ncbi:uncharacterized protein LOC111374158 [Olea europaea var. sylvestris]|uniref:uncharacterized protein LOC111374158 n=1 Tax=Olea europaea var. sylvestris TaxID=158386 RepID=UPI000C1D7BAB|nr:uncharacterized protein LOC111374158 [Olea europaea var. sylvestris]